jgi:hypothetical protein
MKIFLSILSAFAIGATISTIPPIIEISQRVDPQWAKIDGAPYDEKGNIILNQEQLHILFGKSFENKNGIISYNSVGNKVYSSYTSGGYNGDEGQHEDGTWSMWMSVTVEGEHLISPEVWYLINKDSRF